MHTGAVLARAHTLIQYACCRLLLTMPLRTGDEWALREWALRAMLATCRDTDGQSLERHVDALADIGPTCAAMAVGFSRTAMTCVSPARLAQSNAVLPPCRRGSEGRCGGGGGRRGG